MEYMWKNLFEISECEDCSIILAQKLDVMDDEIMDGFRKLFDLIRDKINDDGRFGKVECVFGETKHEYHWIITGTKMGRLAFRTSVEVAFNISERMVRKEMMEE